VLSVQSRNRQQIAHKFINEAVLLQLEIVELDDLFKDALNWQRNVVPSLGLVSLQNYVISFEQSVKVLILPLCNLRTKFFGKNGTFVVANLCVFRDFDNQWLQEDMQVWNDSSFSFRAVRFIIVRRLWFDGIHSHVNVIADLVHVKNQLTLTSH
jgi:hypothetical protein